MKKLLGGIVGTSAVILFLGAATFLGNHGTRIELQNGELFYTETVTPEEANSLADFLNTQFGEQANTTSFQVDRVDNEVCVRMCAQSIAWETDDLDTSFHALELLIQTIVFPAENVKLQLCDEYIEVKKTIDAPGPEASQDLSNANEATEE